MVIFLYFLAPLNVQKMQIQLFNSVYFLFFFFFFPPPSHFVFPFGHQLCFGPLQLSSSFSLSWQHHFCTLMFTSTAQQLLCLTGKSNELNNRKQIINKAQPTSSGKKKKTKNKKKKTDEFVCCPRC